MNLDVLISDIAEKVFTFVVNLKTHPPSHRFVATHQMRKVS